MQCFNYEIKIRAKQGFASSNIERSLSLPCEFWMKKQTSLESNQTESYLWVTCKWLLILTGSGSIAVSRGLAEFSPRLPKQPTLSIVCGFSYKPWPTVQYFNIIEQFWKTCWSRISLCNCYRGFWGIRHFEILLSEETWVIVTIIFDTFSVRGYVAVTHLSQDFRHRQTDIFVVCCIGFQKALSLLVYRNLWYLDAQVCLLKVLFKTWIDYFFEISTEISSDERLKTLILFDWLVPC